MRRFRKKVREYEELDYLGSTAQTTRALAYFRQLLDLEDQARALSDPQRHELRQQHSRPVLLSFKRWMDEQLLTLRPKHPLRGPIQYMTKRWESFTRFLESGAIPIENNAAERSVKLPVIARKNHLFFASPGGGEAAMVFYTLTSTCRRLHIDPSAYLRDVLERLPAGFVPLTQVRRKTKRPAATARRTARSFGCHELSFGGIISDDRFRNMPMN